MYFAFIFPQVLGFLNAYTVIHVVSWISGYFTYKLGLYAQMTKHALDMWHILVHQLCGRSILTMILLGYYESHKPLKIIFLLFHHSLLRAFSLDKFVIPEPAIPGKSLPFVFCYGC